MGEAVARAVWREALWLVRDGIATTQEIDDAIRYGFGLRWAQMGLFETYRVAGGVAGGRGRDGAFHRIVRPDPDRAQGGAAGLDRL